jgi:hydroxyacylglutathione hydrolase
MAVIVTDDEIRLEKLQLGPYDTNAYILACQKTGDSVLIDAPAASSKIMEKLQSSSPRYILLTHDHMDHVGALAKLHASLGVPLAVHAADAVNLPSRPDILLADGDTLCFGRLKLEVIHTPGHTPGSLCFRCGRHLLSGDTIFPGGPGHTDSPDDFGQIIKSLAQKIFVLPDDTRIYPGHGEATVLKKEKGAFAAFVARPHHPQLCGDVTWLSA